LDAEPHPPGTKEFLTVFSGSLNMAVDGEEFNLNPGDTIRFRADKPHIYTNNGTENSKINLVIYYKS